MTLPFSDKPEKSSVYQDLKTVTLQDLTPEQFESIRARMFSEGVNGLEDEYRRLNLLGEAAGVVSSSGPLRNSLKITEIDLTNGAVSYLDFGEGIHIVSQIVAYVVGGTGTQQFRLWYYDGIVSPFEWYYGTTTVATGYFPFNADSQFDEIGNSLFGDGLQLGIRWNGTATSAKVFVVHYRIR